MDRGSRELYRLPVAVLCTLMLLLTACSVTVVPSSSPSGPVHQSTVAASASPVSTASLPSPPPPAPAASPTAEARSPLLRSLPDLQVANDHPRFELATKRSSELADNRISLAQAGSAWLDLPHLQDHADENANFGAKWVNTSLYEVEPPIEWDTSEYEIPEEFDRFVDALADDDVSIDYMLHFWDKEGRARGETLSTPRFKDPQQIEDYVDYARFIVRHFKGRVANYTIWSEPDNCGQEGGIKCVEPDDYVELAHRVIPVIRDEDPQATVAIAPVVLFFERDWLPAVLSSGVAPMFDVIQWHGQYGPAPDDEVTGSYYYEYPEIVEEIRELAEANGFRGEFWSTEMGWCPADADPPCENPDHPWDPVTTDKVAAKYVARAVVMHLGMDVTAGITHEHGPWYEPTERRLATVMAGATSTDLAVDISGDATSVRIQSFGFELPDGDRLFAVWTDEAAVEDDPGMTATLSFSGSSSHQAVGLDVLYGFEQELVTSTSGGDLVVRDLLVRDYPMLIRIER